MGQETEHLERGRAEDVHRGAQVVDGLHQLVRSPSGDAPRSRIVSRTVARWWPAERERLTP